MVIPNSMALSDWGWLEEIESMASLSPLRSGGAKLSCGLGTRQDVGAELEMIDGGYQWVLSGVISVVYVKHSSSMPPRLGVI